MKFIFPSNYNFKSKLLGFIDYSTVIFNIIWLIFIFCLLNLFPFSLTIKIVLFISLCLPILLFSILGFNNENIVYVLIYLIKYFITRQIYLYK